MSFSSNFLDQNILDKIRFIQDKFINNELTISLAESCTGGFLSACFTSFSGSSNYFKGSMVVYSNEAKIKFLDIHNDDINKYGVASQHIVELMARNIQKKYNSDFGLATTGYVDGVDELKYIQKGFDNYAWISVATKDAVYSKRLILNNDRLQNIYILSLAALDMLRKEII